MGERGSVGFHTPEGSGFVSKGGVPPLTLKKRLAGEDGCRSGGGRRQTQRASRRPLSDPVSGRLPRQAARTRAVNGLPPLPRPLPQRHSPQRVVYVPAPACSLPLMGKAPRGGPWPSPACTNAPAVARPFFAPTSFHPPPSLPFQCRVAVATSSRGKIWGVETPLLVAARLGVAGRPSGHPNRDSEAAPGGRWGGLGTAAVSTTALPRDQVAWKKVWGGSAMPAHRPVDRHPTPPRKRGGGRVVA